MPRVVGEHPCDPVLVLVIRRCLIRLSLHVARVQRRVIKPVESAVQSAAVM